MQLFPRIFSYLPFDYRTQNGIYSYIHRCFTPLTIWTSTYIEKLFLKFLNISLFWDPIACKMVPVFVQNQDEIVKLIKNGSVDFGFPILSDAKQKLTGLDSVTLIRAFVSSGCSMIVNLKQCKAESREQLFTSITSQWPILAYIILLSGISGVIIWLLVRVKAYHRQSILSFWSSLVLIQRKVRFKLNCHGFSMKIVQVGIDSTIFE